MRLSTIIVAYNTHELTAVHVRECMNAELVPDEIIVVNDGGTEDLKDKLLQLEKKTRLVYVRVTQDIPWNYNGAFNVGFWCSRGDYVALEDSDHIPFRQAYKEGVEALDKDPKLGRVTFGRVIVDIEDVLKKPHEQWVQGKHLGVHENTEILRREVFINMKGNDERFVNKYGWIGYDWVHRRNRSLEQLGMGYKKFGSFWMVHGGNCPGIEHHMNSQNYHIMRRNTKLRLIQHPEGILKFNFTYEVL